MISYDDARKIISELRLKAGSETIPLSACRGQELAEPVLAEVASPPFTNSAMDGFAVRHADLPGPLSVMSTIYAGKINQDDIPGYKTGHCVRIMTGAVLPEWADTVIPVENTEMRGEQLVFIAQSSPAGSNIRRQGEDIRSGDRILGPGMRMTPERVMVAAAMGATQVTVKQRPKLYFISTGDELCDPGESLAAGQIYNSSKFFLSAAAQAAGITDAEHFTVSDKPDEAAAVISTILKSDGPKIIISTGAVSAGDADFIPEVGRRLDFQALFHKVAIRPGKPVYLARRDDAVWLGLPGNPISTCAGWYFFALPLLHVLAGVRAPNLYNFKLNNDVRKPEHLRCFFRAEVRDHRAWVPQSQGSGHFASSVNQDAFVILPEGTALVKAETVVSGIFIS
jgi:molybdopterin molybdotransferase